MQRILSSLKQAFYQSILILGTVAFIALSSLFIFAQQPSFAAQMSPDAAQKLTRQEQSSKASQSANQRLQNSQVENQREQNYEEQIEAEKDPNKEYRENLAAERRANPNEGVVQQTVEKGKELLEKVTGKD